MSSTSTQVRIFDGQANSLEAMSVQSGLRKAAILAAMIDLWFLSPADARLELVQEQHDLNDQRRGSRRERILHVTLDPGDNRRVDTITQQTQFKCLSDVVAVVIRNWHRRERALREKCLARYSGPQPAPAALAELPPSAVASPA
jgi:hypothetical protein